MSEILPKGEASRRAVRWISSQMQEDAPPGLRQLVHEAIARFDLNPLQAEQLLAFYRDALRRESAP